MSYHSTVFSGNKSGAIVDLFSVMLNILGSEVVLSELNDKGFHWCLAQLNVLSVALLLMSRNGFKKFG